MFGEFTVLSHTTIQYHHPMNVARLGVCSRCGPPYPTPLSGPFRSVGVHVGTEAGEDRGCVAWWREGSRIMEEEVRRCLGVESS